MQPGEYLESLKGRLADYPESLHRKIVYGSTFLPNPRGDKQVVLSHPYTDVAGWQVVELMLLRHALKLASAGLFRSGRIVPFTTLALDYREEGQLVTLPEERARTVKDGHVVRL